MYSVKLTMEECLCCIYLSHKNLSQVQILCCEPIPSNGKEIDIAEINRHEEISVVNKIISWFAESES